MMGRIIGGMLGRAIGRRHGNHPVAGTIIGAGTLMAARRLFPQRYAVIAATVAGAYLTKKWADRAEARRAAEEAHTADPALVEAGVVDSYAGTAEAPMEGEALAEVLPPSLATSPESSTRSVH
ncbi:MAG: hypothetical protein ACO1NN_11060 [Sphingopyxis sp.]